ncbi:MAG: hypothetical protein HOE54_14225, partial [Gammaproteobacteria bacterium]|nr:hypothetical protein [Gammaproteobacteria bacterium]
MKVSRLSTSAAELRDGHASAWNRVEENTLMLSPSPIALTESVSPYMSRTTGHGKVDRLNVRMAHDGATLSLRLSWPDPDRDDELTDLDQFADAIAVMFPLSLDASAFTMGSAEHPVNAWLWRADEEKPFDVIAAGYATSTRRPANSSGLIVTSSHDGNIWVVVLQRSMK